MTTKFEAPPRLWHRWAFATALTFAATVTAWAEDKYADDVFYDERFYDMLTAFGEPDPRHPAVNNRAETYRMVGRSYSSLWTAVRINISPNGAATGTVKILAHTEKFIPIIDYERTFQVAPSDVAAIRATLSKSDFWRLPVYEGTYDAGGKLVAVPVCGDGTSVVIEAQVDNKYRGVDRSTCSREMFAEVRPLIEIFKRVARPHVPRERHQFVHEETAQ